MVNKTKKKELIPLSKDTVDKFSKYLCSKEAGGILDEEQRMAQLALSQEFVPPVRPRPEDLQAKREEGEEV